MAKRGPKGFGPTEDQRRQVRLLIAADISEPVIASRLGICQNTLRKHFADDLTFGRETAIAENLERLDKAASDGNVTAMKHLDGRLSAAGAGPAKTGKKDQANRAAETAGNGTDWGDDLQVPQSVN